MENAMTEKKVFVEPELAKYEESLDEVTLVHNYYDSHGLHKGW